MNLKQSPKRRSFLKKVALGSAFTALLISLAGAMRLLVPRLTRDLSVFKIGLPANYPVNRFTLLQNANVYIHRDFQGIRAVSAVCTHLGCILEISEDGFICPCHGSCYDREGTILTGPAPRSLIWYKIEMSADGQLVVDKRYRVSSEQKFMVV